MNPKLARLLTRLYPKTWRERYGEEFEALLQNGRGGFHTLENAVGWALREHLFPTRRHETGERAASFGVITKQFSAFLPLAMSLTALLLVLCHLAMYGAVREADEGATAHVWQLLMAGQLPLVAFFAIKWLPRAPRKTFGVLALQAGAGLASVAPVFFLGL